MERFISVLVVITGSILSIFASNIKWMIFFRGLVGLGIGFICLFYFYFIFILFLFYFYFIFILFLFYFCFIFILFLLKKGGNHLLFSLLSEYLPSSTRSSVLLIYQAFWVKNKINKKIRK